MPDVATTQPIEIRESCIIEAIDTIGHAVRVTIIKGGKSINGYFYDEQVLQSIARMIEGAHAYADHSDPSQITRSMRDLVGFYKEAQYIPPLQGIAPARVDATLHILESASWLWSIIHEAQTVGKPDLIGLSIDIFGHCQQQDDLKTVTRVISLNSCDIVTRPSAGGSINRILHSAPTGSMEGIHVEPNNTQVATLPNTQVVTSSPNTQVVAPTAPSPSQSDIEINATGLQSQQLEQQIREMQALTAQRQEAQDLMQQVRLQRSQLTLMQRLHESILPDAVKDLIKKKFDNRIFEDIELEREMTDALGMMSQLVKDGLVRGHGFDKSVITATQITEAEKVQAAFDRMFDLEIDTRLGNIKGFTSIREAYARVTGDSSLFAGIRSDSQLGQIPIHESAPITRISEADTTTASFSYLLGTSMNKRLLKDYQAWPAEWMKFCTIAPIRDYKQQTRVRFGAFGSLSTVPEDTAYSTLTLTDSAAVYVPQKRGNLVTVSRETIINDDLQAIKQVPTKLAVAAAYTLAEFVYNFLSSNPTIYDGNTLFTSGGAHSNLGSTALSSAAMQTGITAMREQTNFAGKRLGLRPRFLVVPAELEFTAMVVTKSAGVPGSNNNDINPMLGYVVPIVSPQLTNSSQWYLIGDPREIDTIEIGFVGGQVNPALFIQDSPLLGLNFTSDAISYKIRHEYGGAVTDYRGLYRGV
jgi:Mu-like prophage major head subunit gpT